MRNLAQVVELKMQNLEVIPCIRILRSFFLASRNNAAPFFIETSYSYPAAGLVVSIPASRIEVGSAALEEGHGPEWAEILLPSFTLPAAPDAGAAFTSTAAVIYVKPNGNVIPS